jgi:hypothetical protein
VALYEATGQTFEQSRKRLVMSENNKSVNGEVGYGKPPKDTRFGKGVSGNPSGRPKQKFDMTTLLYRALQKKIIINKNGIRRTVTKFEAILDQLADMAVSRDLAAMRLLFNYVAIQEGSSSDMPTARIDGAGFLPKGKPGAVFDSDSCVIPNAVAARRAAGFLKAIWGMNEEQRDPILVVTAEQAEELARKIRQNYGIALTPEEALKSANDGFVIREADAVIRSRKGG